MWDLPSDSVVVWEHGTTTPWRMRTQGGPDLDPPTAPGGLEWWPHQVPVHPFDTCHSAYVEFWIDLDAQPAHDASELLFYEWAFDLTKTGSIEQAFTVEPTVRTRLFGPGEVGWARVRAVDNAGNRGAWTDWRFVGVPARPVCTTSESGPLLGATLLALGLMQRRRPRVFGI